MIEIPGFKIQEKIYNGSNVLVYRAVRESDKLSCILKIKILENSSLQEIQKIKNEYENLQDLEFEGVIKAHDFFRYSGFDVLVLEDFGGSDLSIFQYPSLDVKEYIVIAQKILKILNNIHDKKIVHCDLKPRNILFNSLTGAVKISDFGMAFRDRERVTDPYQDFENKQIGTLSYISPEQTGMIGKEVDYRTDYYSLGITLYELLTGRLPYFSTDKLEMIHLHVAANPDHPSKFNAKIPSSLDKVVLKLLEKNAEDRYQSVEGILYDLEICKEHLSGFSGVDDFIPGKEDYSIHISIPYKLSGRTTELKMLNSSLKGAKNGLNEFFLIRGEPGTGKSRLVEEFQIQLLNENIIFLTGKFHKDQKHIPYSAFIQTINMFVNRILSLEQKELEEWIIQIKNALGGLGRIMTEIFPSLELLIGKQASVNEVDPGEALNRMNHVIVLFFRLLASRDHPAVIYLDDIHNADSASFDIIKMLMNSNDINHLFFIATINENFYDRIKYDLYFGEIASQKNIFSQILLEPLKTSDVKNILTDIFYSNISNLDAFTSVIVEKTGGNPYFIYELLLLLEDEKIILFDKNSKMWKWDSDRINEVAVSDNIQNLILKNISSVSSACMQTLHTASCLGKKFNFNFLVIFADRPAEIIEKDINELLEKKILIRNMHVSDSSLLKQFSESLTLDDFSFQSDQIYEYIYSIVPEEIKKSIHFKIASYKLQKFSAKSENLFNNIVKLYIDDAELKNISNQFVFETANHLFLAGDDFISDDMKKVRGALSCIAGQRALNLNLHKKSYYYFTTAIEQFTEDSLHRFGDLYARLSYSLAESEYVLGYNSASEKRLLNLLETTKLPEYKIKTYKQLVLQYTNLGRWEEAVNTGLEGLFSNYKKTENSIIENFTLDNLIEYVDSKTDEYYLNLLVAADENARQVQYLLINMISPVFVCRPQMMPWLVFQIFECSLNYGTTSATSYAFLIYSMLLGVIKQDYTRSFKMAQLGMSLNQKFSASKFDHKLLLTFSVNISPWSRPLKESIKLLKDTHRLSIENGDILYAGYALNALVIYKYLSGIFLPHILRDADSNLPYLTQTQSPIIYLTLLVKYSINALSGNSSDLALLQSQEMTEEELLKNINEAETDHVKHWYHILKMQLLYLAKKYDSALSHISMSEKSLVGAAGIFSTAEHYLYESLICSALFKSASDIDKNIYKEKIEKNVEKFKKWAASCPDNFIHKYYLLEAELAKIKNISMDKILEMYDLSISAAYNHGFIQDEAIANERAGLYLKDSGKDILSKSYIRQSALTYIRWGALSKFNNLKNDFPEFLSDIHQDKKNDESSETSSSSKLKDLDMLSILKFTHALSEEIDFKKLLNRLMKIIIENTGSQKGFFILEINKNLEIASKGIFEGNEVIVTTESEVITEKILPVNVINYVKRTHLPVVISDNKSHIDFMDFDIYLKEQNPRSMLCMPVMKGSDSMGILYLENKVTPNIFKPDKMELLRLLAVQATISLENSQQLEQIKKINNELKTEIEVRKHVEEKLRHDSLHDSLTDLPNWELFRDRLLQIISKSARDPSVKYSVLFLDVDRFKLINDSLGHLVGNKLLVEISKMLLSCVRPGDTVARMGGDEFAIILESVEDPSGVIKIVERMIALFSKSIEIEGNLLSATLSIGIVMGQDSNYQNPDDILRDADVAMYRAKENGRNRFEIFNKNMQLKVMRYLEVERDLRKALKNNEFEMYCQPFYSFGESSLSGFEALIRWNHPDIGVILPSEFIPVAEETAIIHELGEIALYKSCSMNKKIQTDNTIYFPVAVNLSSLQFKNEDIIVKIKDILSDTGLAPEYLYLEITESMLMGDVYYAISILKDLQSLGIRVSIDDFGTGYSSLSYLNLLPFEKIKIDKSFVKKILDDQNSATIVNTIISMAHNLGKIAIAEGVESNLQTQYLKDNNCDEYQGYILSRPVPFADFQDFIKGF